MLSFARADNFVTTRQTPTSDFRHSKEEPTVVKSQTTFSEVLDSNIEKGRISHKI